ncbi:MAG TPA: hypothetical protein VHP58_05035 [Alphaproteobacteria bacterium]|nr:hypothetical protein [Alphaproteobacteria bacterium]
MANRSPEQADVLDMVARLKKAADQRASSAPAPVAADTPTGDWEFPAEFYQYFTLEQAA